MRKKILLIDRDGTLIIEPEDHQIDSFEKLAFYPHAIKYMARIAQELDYELVMITNQDGLGTESFPEETFWPVHNKMMEIFASEGITFDEVLIDRSFAKDNAPTRKPRTGMLTKYLSDDQYDLENSLVIGDRLTDVELAKNLGAKAIFIEGHEDRGADEVASKAQALEDVIALRTTHWQSIYKFLCGQARSATLTRTTKETDITVFIDLDGQGKTEISTGIGFFDHMLDQIGKHGGFDLRVQAKGDLHIDEHHTIEDVAITLGQCVLKALGDKRGIQRYGHFLLPMDDCLAQVALDFGGRAWLVWDVDFDRDALGEMPTELFYHFFKSFSDNALCNLNIKVEGSDNHHKIESVFKGFARALKMAAKRESGNTSLPSTKGTL